MSFPGDSSGKEPSYQCRDIREVDLIPGSGDPLEKGMASHSSILAWRIACREELGGLQFIVSQTVGHN